MTAALCMALIPISVFAAGLGKLNVSSGLGEPLRADIELLAVTPEELNGIVATIASEEAYTNQGIERPASHNTIKIDIVKNASGTPTLKLKSTQPISEPFLDMLIQVDWASGRLLREYTVLLDPPGYTGEDSSSQNSLSSAQAPVIRSNPSTNSATNSNSNATGTATQNTKSNRNPRAKSSVAEPQESTEPSAPEYVTQRGDSLAKIARDMQPEGISLDQMLIGLYQANPNAFDGNNMNRLKVGKIIRQPSEQQLSAISRQQASKEVKVQSANWNAYRNKLAGIVAESAPGESEESTQSAGGKIKSAAEDQSAPVQARPKDVVKLSAGEAALTKKEAEDVKSLQAKVTALQEESTAREKSVREAQEKTAALEKQIADMQKLLALKSGAMSDMQRQAEAQVAQDQAKAVQDKTNAQQSQPVEPITNPPATQTASETPPATEATPSAVPPVTVPPDTVPPAVPSSAEVKKPDATITPAPVVTPEPAEEPSIFDSLDLTLLGGGLGLLALLGGGWMLLRNKRKRNLADFEQGIMTSGGLKANTVFGNTSGSSVDTGDTSFLTDFSQSANGGMIDTNDVDPIAEAEVYMAYGRDAQAEEILKDAISKEPKRYELHLKLLEMYAASKSISAFETIAGELYTTLGSEDPTWAKVAEIGHNLEPSNPLYQANTAHSGTAHSKAGEKSHHDKLDANDFSNSPIASETDLDFSFENESLTQDFASPTISKEAIDLGSNSSNHNDFEDEAFKAESLDDAAILNAADDVNPIRSDDEIVFNTNIDATQAEENAVPLSEVSAKEISSKSLDEGLDFDFGQLTTEPETSDKTEKYDSDSSGFGQTMPGFDMSGFSKPQPDLNESYSNTLDITDLNAPSLTAKEAELNSNNDFESFKLPNDNEPSFSNESVNEDAPVETDFNFDLSTLSPEAASYVDEPETTANTFDLSGISLDLQDSETEQASESLVADHQPENDPIEIETKLDLVVAYLDMEDKEGAKELLDEVMKEGSSNQRKRAEALLAKIA